MELEENSATQEQPPILKNWKNVYVVLIAFQIFLFLIFLYLTTKYHQ